jgi:homoserine dehydrogenase
MSEIPKSWSSVGVGTVGGAASHMISSPRVASYYGLQQLPVGVLRKDGWHEHGKYGALVETNALELPDSDVLFIACPSTPDNEPMLTLMRKQLALGRVVVTAEKRTLAYNLAEFKQYPDQLGYWATVGGGTRPLHTLEAWAHDPDNIREMILEPNATTTFIYGEVGNGSDPDEVVKMASQDGLAEPNTAGVYDVIFNEAANDVPSKFVIVLGTIFPHLAELSPDDISTVLTKQNVARSLAEAYKYRYLAAIYQEKDADRAHEMTAGKLDGFELVHESLLLIGGLMRVDVDQNANAIGRFKDTRGPEAGFYVELGPYTKEMDPDKRKETSDGHIFSMGTGAGGLTTANAMLDNYQAIRKALLKNS